MAVNTELREIAEVKPQQLFSFLFSAIIHDMAHPGKNNAFLINTQHEFAIRYNDTSVLESFHVSQAYFLMRDPTYDIFSTMTDSERR
jgi:hypothetical protein